MSDISDRNEDSFSEYGYFSAEKFLVLTSTVSQASKKESSFLSFRLPTPDTTSPANS